MNQCVSDSENEFDPLKNENPLREFSPIRLWCGGKFSPTRTAASDKEGAIPVEATMSGGRKWKVLNVDFGDKYFGEVLLSGSMEVPHGSGRLFSQEGKHFYDGNFVNRNRDGNGMLNTERYTLWCKWKMNRPDLTNPARVEYPDGTKYCGFLSSHQSSSPGSSITSAQRSRLSKFSIWVHSLVLVRERWGEIVHSSGDRYLGQWKNDMPSGFGCYMTKAGDRYVGLFQKGKFHDTGTLFLRTSELDKERVKLPDGVGFLFQQDQPADQQEDAAEVASEKIKTRFRSCFGDSCAGDVAECTVGGSGRQGRPGGWNGIAFDGVWEMGRFLGEGHVTLPCGSRVTAEWKSLLCPTKGRVFVTSLDKRCSGQKDMNTRNWLQCFHWEPLLSGSTEDVKEQRYAACASYRERLKGSSSDDEVQSVLADFCNSEDSLRNALKVFRRCFYFLHGTCGRSSEIGSGWGSTVLGWCNICNAYGGCIHHVRGRRISVSDVELALTDIISFVRSAERWVVEMLGSVSVASRSCSLFVTRRLLDLVLRDVHSVLFNLYVYAYNVEDAALTEALERVRQRTTLDDLGVNFARMQRSEKLFDPYADAVNRIERLGRGVWTYGTKLKVLGQWSMEIDLSIRLSRVNVDDEPLALLMSRDAQPSPGSADDLIPIHQYVLMKARLNHLYVHTKLLVDFSSEDIFMEFTSHENFFVITFQACTLILSNLHPLLRDESNVLAPPTLFEERLRTAVHSFSRMAGAFLSLMESHSALIYEPPLALDSEDMQGVAIGYVKAWIPEAVDMVSTYGRGTCGDDCKSISVPDLLQMEETRGLALLNEQDFPRAVALFCWFAASSILSVLRIRLGLVAATGTEVLVVETDMTKFLDDYAHWCDAHGEHVSTLVLLVGKDTARPLFLRRAAVLLSSIL
uniref:VPS9 domain-containing protein n=1 Tax=Trypanosoma congolense (strain IL3000) TaxID=1068625 RepID=G0UK15_TRYCI|nr:conserved hypothetical protein [Trypanosoma congolense IL3000]